MRGRTAALLGGMVLGLVVSCSHEDDPRTDEPTSSATTPAAQQQTLREICPQVEAAINEMPEDTYAKMSHIILAVDLKRIAASADLEAQNALRLLQEPVERFPDAPDQSFEGHADFIQGLDAFAERCWAAGSSALR